MSLVHTKNVQAIQIVTPVMFVKQVTTVYVYFLMFYSTPNASICECASVCTLVNYGYRFLNPMWWY